MAKINGFELKNIVEFKGHEQEPLIQGDVFYKGKRVGFYSQDAWGGMDNFDIDYKLDNELYKEVNDLAKNYKGGVLFKKLDDLYNKTYNINIMSKMEQKGYEYLFMDLIQLKDHEDIYKKYKKKFNVSNIVLTYEDLFRIKISTLEPKDTDKTYFKYSSLNDFIKEV